MMRDLRAALSGLASPQLRRLLPALAAFVAASALFINNVFLAPDRALAAQVLTLAERIRADDAGLRTWLHELNNPVPQVAEAPPPRYELLRKLTAIAQQSDAHLLRVTPQPDNRGPMQVEAEAHFAGLIELVGQLEARGGIVRHLQVQPARGDGTDVASVATTFLLDWTPGVRDPVASPSLARHLAASAELADPFRPLSSRSGADLRTGHFLSGITTAGEETFATIDGQDYRVGDPIGSGTLTEIRKDAVQLSSGSARSWLHLGAR